MSDRLDPVYRESGASWRPLGVVLVLWAIGVAVDASLPGGLHAFGWALVLLVAAGAVGLSTYARRSAGRVEVSHTDLVVGRETLPLSTVDSTFLFTDGAGGAAAGARVLGGGSGLPKGRTPFPLRLADGTVVVVPCRDPAALGAALRTAVGN